MTTTPVESSSVTPVPFNPIQSFENWFEDLENRIMGPRAYLSPNIPSTFVMRNPRVDIIDREKEICVRAELPGVEKDDLSITLQDETLTINAKMQSESKEESGTYCRRELHHGTYQRTLRLPVRVNAGEAKAEFKHGLLELTIPKNPDFQPTRISIN